MCDKENNKWIKKCPECGKKMEYNSNKSCNRAVRTNSICVDCHSKKRKLRYKGKSKWIKFCPDCEKIQYYSKKEGLTIAIKNNTKCEDCFIKEKQLFFEKGKEERRAKRKKYMKIYLKKYDEINKIKKQEYDKIYRQKPDVIKRKKEQYKKRDRTVMEKIHYSISKGIWNDLKNKKLSKNRRHYEDLIINTLQEIIEHLERNFLPGMSWDNYGRNGWHIDHIIPIVFFRFTSADDVEFKYCWSIENLQPMWEKNNASKKDKIILWGKEINAKDIERDYFSKIASFHTN